MNIREVCQVSGRKANDAQREKLIKARQHGLSPSESMDFAGIRSRTTAWRIWKEHLAEQATAPKPISHPQRDQEERPAHRRDCTCSTCVDGFAQVRAALEAERTDVDPVTSSRMSQEEFKRTLEDLAKQFGHGAVKAALAERESELRDAVQQAGTTGEARGTRVRRIYHGVSANVSDLPMDSEILDHTRRPIVDRVDGVPISTTRPSRWSVGRAFPVVPRSRRAAR